MSRGDDARAGEIAGVEPDEVFRGVVLITVPHMDDEALACGGTIARLTDKRRLHFVYATDGMKAPEPVLPWVDRVSADLGAIRRAESVAAMGSLGVPPENITFLDLPEGRLERVADALRRRIAEVVAHVRPNQVLTPFRYDRHRDHIALNDAVTRAASGAPWPVQLWEYFVYHYWRLLPRRDVRRYVGPEHLRQVSVEEVSSQKRAALDCFTSQTTRFYPWQARPNLTPALLHQVSHEPEIFLRYDAAYPGTAVFRSGLPWIPIAHRLESPLKRYKDRAVAVSRRLLGATGPAA
jgi:LmbE family N-acetylglucosaminyl deacetylase